MARRNFGYPLAALCAAAALAGCTPAAEVDCVSGWTLCDGTCRALGSDEANCGACGNGCALDESCVAGACATDCTKQLHAPTSDAWGNGWDGIERPTASHSAARSACEAIGGRLPTLSELHRVSAVKTGAVGDTYKTDVLWALTPSDASNHMAMKLSDGVTSVRADGTAANYRCLCPAPRPDAFVGGACQGAPGAECFSFPGDPILNYDAEDRPLATAAAAIWDCAFSGGQLATPERLAAAVTANLPNGTDTWLHSADRSRTDRDAVIKWANASWVANGNVSMGSTADLRPYRCAGPRSAGIVPASSVPGGVRSPSTSVVADGADHASGAQVAFATAIGSCLDDGAHLPTTSELASVAMQGLPRLGASAFLWTADELEAPGASTFSWSGIARWPGGAAPTDEGIPYVSPASLGALAKTSPLPYRCVHPPVDPSIAAPAACNGGCTSLVLSAGRGAGAVARIWLDSDDRAATTYDDAVYQCSSAGGRLASSRDLIEGIRHGLPGSAGAIPENVLTADIAEYPVTSCSWFGCTTNWYAGLYAIPQWPATGNATYADDAGVRLALTATARFRCAWTNEVR